MSKPLSPETMALVKATAPALQQHGVEITTRMYQRLFVDPEIKALFDISRAQIRPQQAARGGDPRLRAECR
jgi:hemoglobin-like flavoprotein